MHPRLEEGRVARSPTAAARSRTRCWVGSFVVRHNSVRYFFRTHGYRFRCLNADANRIGPPPQRRVCRWDWIFTKSAS